MAKVADFGLSVKMDHMETHLSNVYQVCVGGGGRSSSEMSQVSGGQGKGRGRCLSPELIWVMQWIHSWAHEDCTWHPM